MKFINVYLNEKGLWSASLCDGEVECGMSVEIENIGGGYPKARGAELDAKGKWGRNLLIKTSYGRLFEKMRVRSVYNGEIQVSK